MGRKVHPIGFRLGIVRDWTTRWYAEGAEYTSLLEEDRLIRKVVREEVPNAGISTVEIERFPNQVYLQIHTAKPGVIIGRKGVNVNALKAKLQELTGKRVKIDVVEIEKPELDARLVAESIAEQLERRISHKRAMKQATMRAMRMGAKGIMITCGGRLAGAEMARKETVREGRVPRHTLRADIDYAQAEALTTFGRIGVKVWIYKGDVLPEKAQAVAQQ
ncbi:MAG TPA: 30S ribosomal protein S3 [Anaerolineae bacterium]|nr:30S ribosomal protein S3 [Anaerolineae bacterium]